MRQTLALSMLLSLYLSPCFADTNTQIKKALEETRNSITQQKALSKNPLEAMNFENYASRGFLYYYRALASLEVSKSKKNSDRLEYVDKAINDLELSKQSLYVSTTLVDQYLFPALREKIELSLQEKKYDEVTDAIEKLPRLEQKLERYIIYYGYALYESSQEENFIHLAKKYLPLFQDQAFVASILPKKPDWGSLLANIKEYPGFSKAKLKGPTFTKATTELILNHPDKYMNQLGKNMYMSDAINIYRIASKLYFSLSMNKKLNPKEKKFVNTFQKHMYKLAPNFLDELITSHWKRSELKTAEALSKAFLRTYEGHGLYPKVLYNLGRIQEDEKRYKDAFQTFQSLSKKSDDANYAEYAMFRAPWVLHLLKKDSQAKPFFERYVELYPDGKYASTAEYLLLKQQHAAYPKKESNEIIQKKHQSVIAFIEKYPLNFYSMLLMDEYALDQNYLTQMLGTEISEKAGSQFTQFKSDIEAIARLNAYKELLSFGLKEDAIKVLKGFPFDEQNEVFMFYLADQFHKLEDANGEETSLVKIFTNFELYRKNISWKCIFPNYRQNIIEEEINNVGSEMSALLVLSIIRQESAFNPEARSVANALGLMQLTPGTAQDAANALNLKNYSLTNERDNLKLGIQVMSSLLKKYNYRLDYALSAYNAGETTTQLWIDLRGDLAPVEFIESIPFQETRLYVKNILRNYGVYRMLYDKRPNSLISYKFARKD